MGGARQLLLLDALTRVGKGKRTRCPILVLPFPWPTRVSPSGPCYLSVSWRLLPRDKEIERKKPWTAGTVYIKRVLERSCGNTRVSDALA